MNRPVVFVDLDRTVIYSAAALDLTGPDHRSPRLLCVETYQSKPLSFMTETAAATFVALTNVATVVPTTTRTPTQLSRVRLPGPPPHYAIASNGGHLLTSGHPDPAWTSAVQAKLSSCAPLEEVATYMQTRVRTARWRRASELFLYAVVDRDSLPCDWEQDLGSWCGPRGWDLSLQGRKLYAVPRPLTKSAAASEVASRSSATVLLAAGDSLLDGDLLTFADAAIRPAHGELASTGFSLPTLTVTNCTGVLAGEEILEWLLANATALAAQPDFVRHRGGPVPNEVIGELTGHKDNTSNHR